MHAISRRILVSFRQNLCHFSRGAAALFLTLLVCAFPTFVFAFDPGSDGSDESGAEQRSLTDVSHRRAEDYRLDKELTRRSSHEDPAKKSRVIVELLPGAQLPHELEQYASGRKLHIINGRVLSVPNGMLPQLAAYPEVFRVHHDRAVANFNYRTALTVGTRAIQDRLGLTGAGVGIAIVDSGVTSWHDDLTNTSTTVYPYGNQRIAAFVDFVNGQIAPYDDNGHGSHVAGIIGGNGYDSHGKMSGGAPGATLVSLKVLDAQGRGTVSNIIAALDWAVANRQAYNIRIVNLSIGAAVRESYMTDPLTLAAKRAVEAGIIVVAAAGNFGRNSLGLPQYGGINSPANAPWVLTVGASTTNGTTTRVDDGFADYSSRGPTYIDWTAKPDLLAPGTGTVSLAAPGSTFYTTKQAFLVQGSVSTATLPYLSVTGTSMAAPVVSATVALMLQANPKLTPNAVKAILQYTAQANPAYNRLTQGAGFLNSVGAARLARFFAIGKPGDHYPTQRLWSKQILWGNHLLKGGVLGPKVNAWAATTDWGVAKTDAGDNIVWGTTCDTDACDNIVWGTDGPDNIVWGTSADSTTTAPDNIVWGTSVGTVNNIVWGTVGGDNIVWGTDCGGVDCDNIVWGTVGADNIVWGTAEPADNIVWGTAGLDTVNIVWGTTSADPADNIVWGTLQDADNIVWGTGGDDNIVWGTDGAGGTLWAATSGDDLQKASTLFEAYTDEQLLGLEPMPASTSSTLTTSDPAPTPTSTAPTADPAPATTTTEPAPTTSTTTTTTDPASTTTTTDPASAPAPTTEPAPAPSPPPPA